MFDHPISLPTPEQPWIATPDPLLRYFQDHAKALSSAAGLLAGRRGRRLVATIMAALRDDRVRSLVAIWIDDLSDILALEHVHVIGSEEEARFAAIDPSDPVVEELCLLTDQLTDAIAARARWQDEAHAAADRRAAA